MPGGEVSKTWKVQEIKRIRWRKKGTRGNSLEAGEQSRSPPWVFLSGLQGSGHNSLNWFSLLHTEDRAAESQRDLFLFSGSKVARTSLCCLSKGSCFSSRCLRSSHVFTLCLKRRLSATSLVDSIKANWGGGGKRGFERWITVKDWLRKHSLISA